MAPHSSTLAWKIPWMGEPGRLPSRGSHRVGHDGSDLAAAAAAAGYTGEKMGENVVKHEKITTNHTKTSQVNDFSAFLCMGKFGRGL